MTIESIIGLWDVLLMKCIMEKRLLKQEI